MSHGYRKTTTTTRNRGRPLYAPPPPPGGHNRSHSVLGYWVPLVTIGTIAVGGLAAWIWSERGDHDEDDYPYDKPPRPQTGVGAPYPTQGSQPYPGPPQPGPGQSGFVPLQEGGPPPPVGADGSTGGSWAAGGAASTYFDASSTQTREQREQIDQGFFGRVQGAMRRTPSPQQFFDHASKQVMGGMAAAGAALSSIIENPDSREHSQDGRRRDERDGFSDHERWSEEAEERQRINITESASGKRSTSKGKSRSKRTVAVVLSANVDTSAADDGAFHTEHGSILSHLPSALNPELTDLFVLIYAPNLKSLPKPEQATSTLGSSYSAISTPAQTPGSELQSMSPRVEPSNPTFDALYNQALSLVNHPTQIMPFTTPAGYVSMLKHLSPQLVYISDTLSGHEGETVAQLKGWVGHTVLVVGDEGHGGLADTETETEDESRRQKKSEKTWWERSSFVGLGKEVDVVDATRVADDWARRVNGRE
ncbi:hypothetical protein AC579_8603 [Pseudocercospora musae]|uniref:Uncharacterized protein n=1 Tax=Pseudocercospora musae TaxID=113226 RepID=A0A139HML8_9PEZI|nr:hypothetical protein AC579_8603 [Pseudocercospora musae]